MTKLIDLIRRLDRLPADATLYAAKPWCAESLAEAVPRSAQAPDGLDYLLEVDLARDSIRVWREWREAEPSTQDSCRAVIHYVQYDAYLPASGDE